MSSPEREWLLKNRDNHTHNNREYVNNNDVHSHTTATNQRQQQEFLNHVSTYRSDTVQSSPIMFNSSHHGEEEERRARGGGDRLSYDYDEPVMYGKRANNNNNNNNVNFKTAGSAGASRAMAIGAGNRGPSMGGGGGGLPRKSPKHSNLVAGHRFVSLPSVDEPSASFMVPDANQVVPEDIRGRVSCFGTAREYNRTGLGRYLRQKFKNDTSRGEMPISYQDALYTNFRLDDNTVSVYRTFGDVFYFEYGVVVMWSLNEQEENEVLTELGPFELDKLDPEDVEYDEFEYHYSKLQKPKMYDDIITLNEMKDHRTKLAISYALSQSIKLTVFEQRILKTIESTKHVPLDLARTGEVHLSRKSISRKIGHLFSQTAEVNLVSNVLDVPDFFWEEADKLQDLYTAVRGYMEIGKRADVLNKRIEVVHDMLTMLQEQQNQLHGEYLEWIVIWLIVFEVIIGLTQILVDVFYHR
eukprot:Nk52_evm1s2435 gene=Nk52_evmTU1s2435